MNYGLLYSTTLVISFLLTLIFFVFHLKYRNPVTHLPLQIIYILNMISSFMCIVWVIVDGKKNLIAVNYIANLIEFNCLGYSGYSWLRYCLKFIDVPMLKKKSTIVMLTIPIAIVTLLIVTTPLTHWIFYIDENGFFQRGSLYFFQFTAYLYLFVSSTLCVLYRKKCTTSFERNRLAVLALFVLPPTLFGSIQIFMPSGAAPTLQFSIVLSLILVFINEMDQKITRDSLTQLKNRYEIERILQHKMNDAHNSKTKLYVLVSDLDDFKQINDKFGHHQGDVALNMVGQVLSKVTDQYDAICGRMSGDEFVSLIETESYETVMKYQQDLESMLLDACSNLPYTLQLSIGAAVYDGNENLMQLLNQSDTKMYEQKKMRKQERTAT